jgi:molybdopterin molybdotransferase
MNDFFNVLSPEKALEELFDAFTPRVESEVILTADALGRVTSVDIYSHELLPGYPRAAMDGYSVRARDTFGATEGFPAYLEMAGEVPMGHPPTVTLFTGQAAIAHTGGMLADGADAVVMFEQTQRANGTVEVLKPVAPGENVIQPGEDVKPGDPVLPAGSIIRPQDIGGLMALGITSVAVARRPRVAIVSTGDELVPPEQTPGPGQIRDINTYSISALVTQYGGIPIPVALVPDEYDMQREAALRAMEQGDIVVFSAGSSLSTRDMTAEVINSLGKPGVIAHGIALRPGKPTIVAVVDGKPAFGLPGNPVSAMVVFDLLVRPTLYAMTGCAEPPQPRIVHARLLRNIASTTGREDYIQVRVMTEDGDYYAEPIFGKSNLIYTLVRADGVVRVPMDAGGLYSGETVAVRMY